MKRGKENRSFHASAKAPRLSVPKDVGVKVTQGAGPVQFQIAAHAWVKWQGATDPTREAPFTKNRKEG